MTGIRKLMLECPNFVREAVITDNQIDLYKLVKGYGLSGMTSRQLADHKSIPVQNASMALRNLAKKKYLRKVECVSESGGIEYTFLAIEF